MDQAILYSASGSFVRIVLTLDRSRQMGTMPLQRSSQATSEPSPPPLRHSQYRRTRSHQPSSSYVAPPRQLSRAQSYRPFVHRTATLALFAGVVLALVGVLEHGIRILPHDPTSPDHGGALNINGAVFAVTTPVVTAASTTPTRSLAPAPPSGGKPQGSPPPPPPPPAGRPPAPSPPPPSSSSSSSLSTPRPSPSPHTSSQAAPQAQANTISSQISAAASPTSIVNDQLQWESSSSNSQQKSEKAKTPLALSTRSTKSIGVAASAAPSATTSTSIDHAQTKDALVTSDVPLTLVNDSSYFVGIYLPVLVSVLLRLLANGLYRYTKLIDPFTLLSRPNGALLKEFFGADHLESKPLLGSWYALRGRRWAILCAATIYGATQLLALFASELNTIYWSSYSFQAAKDVVSVNGQALWINRAVARILQAVLVFIFILTMILWLILRRTHSGLTRSPASLGAIASLVGHPGVAADLAAVRALADDNIVRTLGDRRYRLQSYVDLDQREIIGLVPTDVRYEDLHVPSSKPQINSAMAVDSRTSTPPSYSQMRRDISVLSLLTITAVILLGILAAYCFSTSPAPSFEQFMDPQRFGPRFVLTALVLILKAPLLDICIRLTASVSFARLRARPRHADLDIKAPVPLTALGSIWYALRRSAWLAASFAVAGGIVVELFLISLPGVPFKALQQNYIAPHVSWYASTTCLALLLLLAIVGWVRLVLKHGLIDRHAPRPILGPIMMSVAGTSMAADGVLERSDLDRGSRGVLYQLCHANPQRWVVDYSHAASFGHQIDRKQ